jgi:hypothetical protein
MRIPTGVSYSPINPRHRAGAAGGAGGISSARRAWARGLIGRRPAGAHAASDATAKSETHRRLGLVVRGMVSAILQRESREGVFKLRIVLRRR